MRRTLQSVQRHCKRSALAYCTRSLRKPAIGVLQPVMMSNAVRACARCCRRLARQSWRLLGCLHSEATLRSLMLLCGRKHECINIECASRGLVSFFIFFSRFKLKVRLSCSALDEVYSNVYRPTEHLVLHAYARPSISQMIRHLAAF
jgi:hypothetical protein